MGFFVRKGFIFVILDVLSLTVISTEASTNANLSDPCNNYTVLNDSWRSTNNSDYLLGLPYRCDTYFTWSGWYRLFVNGVSAHMPDSCVPKGHCGSATPLWLHGGHPTVDDGVVTRDICGHYINYCCFFWSFPIQVKACPGSYFVYKLVKPAVFCTGYCAEVGSNYTISTAITPTTKPDNVSEPCKTYTALDEPWRANGSQPSKSVLMSDASVSWSGWYRLFINGVSAQIPDTCVEKYSCGTEVPLWIRDGHPTVEDGVVTRDVCGHWDTYCCYYGSFPIEVKACPGYYVYKLDKPTSERFAYCAVVSNISNTETTEMSSTGVNITMLEGCASQKSEGCLGNLLEQIENITAQVLPLDTVTKILTVAFNTSETILQTSSARPSDLAAFGNRVLKSSEKLISALVKPTDTSANVSFTLETVEGRVFMVGPRVSLDKIPQLDTTNSYVDIDLLGIARNNNETRSAAVAFMSYTTMENLLKANFFNASNDTINTMMSTVISVTLPKTTNTQLTKPVNFTFRHIRRFESDGSLSCVYWNISEWIVDGCSVLNTNSSHTVCSCVHLSTFALIMQTSRPPTKNDPPLNLLNLVCVIVGLLFFSLALLSFSFCRWSPGVNNVARINICISLLLAHLLFLLTQQFLNLIVPQQVWCVVISGLLHFLFLSGFVWMFVEAVLLFISVKNLSRISSKKKEVLSSVFLCVIGYVVALVVVCMSVGLRPEGYGSEKCWIKLDRGFIWSFLGPVCVILASNTILFINIIINLNSALAKLNADVSQLRQTKIMVFKSLGQFVVLGCPWFLGFFTNNSKVLEIIFLVLNSQQGTFIFMIYCLLNTKIRQQYWKCFTCLCSGSKQQ